MIGWWMDEVVVVAGQHGKGKLASDTSSGVAAAFETWNIDGHALTKVARVEVSLRRSLIAAVTGLQVQQAVDVEAGIGLRSDRVEQHEPLLLLESRLAHIARCAQWHEIVEVVLAAIESGEAVIEGQIEGLNEAWVARLPGVVFSALRSEPDLGQGRGAISAGRSVLDDVVEAAEEVCALSRLA